MQLNAYFNEIDTPIFNIERTICLGAGSAQLTPATKVMAQTMDLFDETAKVCMRTTIVVAVPDTHVQAQEALPNHPLFWKQLTLKGQTPDAICLDGYIGKSVPIVLR